MLLGKALHIRRYAVLIDYSDSQPVITQQACEEGTIERADAAAPLQATPTEQRLMT